MDSVHRGWTLCTRVSRREFFPRLLVVYGPPSGREPRRFLRPKRARNFAPGFRARNGRTGVCAWCSAVADRGPIDFAEFVAPVATNFTARKFAEDGLCRAASCSAQVGGRYWSSGACGAWTLVEDTRRYQKLIEDTRRYQKLIEDTRRY